MQSTYSSSRQYFPGGLSTPAMTPSPARFPTVKRLSKIFTTPKKKRPQLMTPESGGRYNRGELESASAMLEIQSVGGEKMHRLKRVSRFNFRDLKCVFCDEPLTSILQDEDPPIVLTCSHKCHPECLLMMLDKTDLSYEPICEICKTPTKCEDEEVEEAIFRKLLLQDEEEEFLSEGEEIVIERVGPVFNGDPKTPEDQIIREWDDESIVTRGESSIENEILQHVTSPKVSLAPEVPKLHLSLTPDQARFTLKCFLTFEGPQYATSETANREDTEKLINEMMHKLNEEIIEWNGISLSDLGELICFDYLFVGPTEEDAVKTRCFLFEKILLVVTMDGTAIEGTVLITHLSTCIETEGMAVQLNLKSELLPLVYLNSDDKIIVKKWFHLISKVALLDEDEEFEFDNNQLIQLSTNAWDLIESNRAIIPFEKPSLKIYEMTVPKPVPLPVSLVLCVSLINTTQLSNNEYLHMIKQLIRTAFESLFDRDSFGLVVIGKDAYSGEFCQSGTFIGMASANWSEWSDIVEELEVSADEVFYDDYDLVYESLLHASKLVLSNKEFNDPKRVKKLMCVFNLLQEEIDDGVGANVKEAEIQRLLSMLLTTYQLELDSLLIGETYSLKYLYFLTNSLKLITVEQGFYQVTLGSQSRRFDTYDNLIKELPQMISDLRDISVPNFETTITTQSMDDILISAIENSTNGEMIQLQSHLDQMKISVLNLKYNETKTVLCQLSIDRSAVSSKQIELLDLAIVQGKWFNTLCETDRELSSIRISVSDLPTHATRPNSITTEVMMMTDDADAEDVVEFPILLPPLISSQREILYVKREIELMFISNLMASIESTNVTRIAEAISLIWGIVKSCDGYTTVNVERKPRKLSFYVEDLCDAGKMILELLQNLETKKDAIKKGYDLCFKLGIQ